MASPVTLPQQSAAAGILLTGPDGRTLLLATHNRAELVLPGGVVEDGESPAAAAEREAAEEVGLDVAATELLVVQHRSAVDGLPARLMFVFDSKPLTELPHLRLQPTEISAAFWLDPDSAVQRHASGGRARLAAAFDARLRRQTVYMDADRVLPPIHH